MILCHKKNVFTTRAELYCSAVTLEAYFGLFQERAKKYTGLVCEERVFRCLFCTAKYCLVQLNTETKLNYFSVKKAEWRREDENMHFRQDSYKGLSMLCACVKNYHLKGGDSVAASYQ